MMKSVENNGTSDPRQKCCWQGKYFFDALKAMISRLVFIFHATIAIWRAGVVVGPLYWLISLVFILTVAECFYVLLSRRGQEWSWFQWSVFLYLCSVIPPIWILELEQVYSWQSLSKLNGTNTGTDVVYVDNKIVEVSEMNVTPSEWVVAVEQTLLVAILFSRWLMPKGALTRNQLSSLLLIHLGTASDIVDFLTLLAEAEIKASNTMPYGVLFIWSWALLQFPFVVTSTKEDNKSSDDLDDVAEEIMMNALIIYQEKTTILRPTELNDEKAEDSNSCLMRANELFKAMIETEIWGICVSVFAQDGPFCIMRVLAIISFHVVNYTNYFFATKNAIVLILQVYRLVALCIEYREEKKQKKEKQANERKKVNQMWSTFLKAHNNFISPSHTA